MDGLAGEKIKVTLDGEPVGIELGAEEEAELDREAFALVGTAAAPRDETGEAVMVGRLGIEDIELDMLVTAGMEVEVEVLRADEEVEAADEEVMEVMEVIIEDEAILVEEAADEEEEAMAMIMDEEEETTSSMFIMDSLTSSTESDMDCKRSCEAAAGFQSG
jgi:hypothetical protein